MRDASRTHNRAPFHSNPGDQAIAPSPVFSPRSGAERGPWDALRTRRVAYGYSTAYSVPPWPAPNAGASRPVGAMPGDDRQRPRLASGSTAGRTARAQASSISPPRGDGAVPSLPPRGLRGRHRRWRGLPAPGDRHHARRSLTETSRATAPRATRSASAGAPRRSRARECWLTLTKSTPAAPPARERRGGYPAATGQPGRRRHRAVDRRNCPGRSWSPRRSTPLGPAWRRPQDP